jgi:hypothetical protein
MSAVQKSTFSDLETLDTRLHLLHKYIETVKANAKYREFINKHKMIKISN